MDKYNIQRNKEKLTDADIAKGKDFEALMNARGGASKPFYKKPGFYGIVAVTGVMLVVGGYFLSDSSTTPTSTAPFVAPPIAGVDIADTTWSVNAGSGQDFIYATGSVVRIPANAFTDSTGKVVDGPVEIRYREFHDPASIFIAGIPMTYDSAGQQYHFESAGMLEITAWQNGHPLKTNPAAPIRVAMASNTPEDKFNIYYLDTVKKNWSFIKKDDPIVIRLAADTTSSEAGTAASTPKEPIKPVKADAKKPGFAIAYNPAEFPELNAYKGVRFEVDESKTPYNRADSKIQWEDVNITRNPDGATYTVVFTKDEKEARYVTYAAVDGANYAAAMQAFDAKYAEYQASLKAKEEAANNQSQRMQLIVEEQDRHRMWVNDTLAARAMAIRAARGMNNETEGMIMREFMLENFGVWNSDCPSSLPEGAEIFATLKDSRNNKPLQVDKVYLVERGRNAIFTYYTAALKEFKFNPDSENMLWAITPDGFLAIYSADDFKTINTSKKNVTLTMQVTSTKVKTPAEARSALGINPT